MGRMINLRLPSRTLPHAMSFVVVVGLGGCSAEYDSTFDDQAAAASVSAEQRKPPAPPPCQLVAGALWCEGQACEAICGPWSQESGTCRNGDTYRKGHFRNGSCCNESGCTNCDGEGHFQCKKARALTNPPGTIPTVKAP